MKENNKFKLGITGGIACGKSTAVGLFSEWGWSVIDADDIAHDLMQPGQDVFSELVDHFGVAILSPTGEINRPALAQIVFSNENELKRLNSIVHPHVHTRWKNWLANQKGLCAVVIPLLYETGSEDEFDEILCLASSEDEVLKRLVARGLTEDDGKRRMAAQLPSAIKMARADIPIMNDGNLMELKEKLYAAHRRIENKEKQQDG